MLGLNKADASNEYSCRKYAPTSWRWYDSKACMRLERIFHFRSPRLECIEQVAVPAVEILQHFGQLLSRRLRIEAKHAVDDMVGPGLVGAC